MVLWEGSVITFFAWVPKKDQLKSWLLPKRLILIQSIGLLPVHPAWIFTLYESCNGSYNISFVAEVSLFNIAKQQLKLERLLDMRIFSLSSNVIPWTLRENPVLVIYICDRTFSSQYLTLMSIIEDWYKNWIEGSKFRFIYQGLFFWETESPSSTGISSFQFSFPLSITLKYRSR